MTAESAEERRVWELLTRDFYWDVRADHPVKVYGEPEGPTRLQILEVAITTILAYVCPEFEWHVTPNRRDNGLDFIGEQRFLDDRELGIAAAIKVGGQCKKRTNVGDVLAEVAGSLIRMADAVNPTFFVVALSARLTRRRVENARGMLERQLQRHCHVLDRVQIEGLMSDHLVTIVNILREGLTDVEVEDVRGYLESRREGRAPSVTVDAAKRVLAGAPFRIDVSVRSTLVSNPRARLWWRPGEHADADPGVVSLIGPVGADGPDGVALASNEAPDDPLQARHLLELVTYSVGHVDLGEILVGLDAAGSDTLVERIPLGRVQVIENMRPRFFERPFRAGLTRLSRAYDRALAGAVASVGVVGAGGSGKSRMCEEFALEKRRRGCCVVSAKQAKTHDDPHRLLADLLFGLAAEGLTAADPAETVIHAVSCYDRALAEKAGLAIKSVFGTSDQTSGAVTEQSMLSALLLLIVARSRRAPLIVHLQDLHWCSADVLLLLERLVWQLTQLLPSLRRAAKWGGNGVLFVFEGRIRESHGAGDDVWTSEPFEAFLQRTDGTTISCSAFPAEDGLAFVRLLFEDRHSARRLVAEDLLELQGNLIRRINRTAGGNPFHSLEQVQILRERRVLGQNPDTGLLYMIQPEPVVSVLPESVFASIKLRWQYLRDRSPELALLLWGCALLEDRLPPRLFRRLWVDLAPHVSLGEVDGTDMLWTGDGHERDVVFRHENYFESLRRFGVSDEARERVVKTYCGWFESLRRPSPADRFRWARALLELPDPDMPRARALVVSALRGTRRHGDARLARRISAFHLDLVWTTDDRSPIAMSNFLRRCGEEIELSRDLLTSDRDQAAQRLSGLRERIRARLSMGDSRALEGLERLQLTAEVVYSQLLFNDRRPAQASEIAANAVRGLRSLRRRSSTAEDPLWDSLEMETPSSRSHPGRACRPDSPVSRPAGIAAPTYRYRRAPGAVSTAISHCRLGGLSVHFASISVVPSRPLLARYGRFFVYGRPVLRLRLACLGEFDSLSRHVLFTFSATACGGWQRSIARMARCVPRPCHHAAHRWTGRAEHGRLAMADIDVVRRFYDDFCNKRQLGIADELMTSGHQYHDPNVPAGTGPAAMAEVVGTYQKGVDGFWDVQDLVASGDRVVARWIGRGTHVGEMNGIAATGRKVEVDAISIHRMENGKIAENWTVWDTLGFLRQLGVIPEPATARA